MHRSTLERIFEPFFTTKQRGSEKGTGLRRIMMMPTTDNHGIILIIEDSEDDYLLMIEGFKKAKVINPIFHCEDGDEGLDYLFRRGQYTDPSTSPLPQVILLDLNLPGTDGREILEEIKKDEKLKKIPVIILTTSSDERDIEACYEAGANSYVQKLHSTPSKNDPQANQKFSLV